jgi:hypothetical protein
VYFSSNKAGGYPGDARHRTADLKAIPEGTREIAHVILKIPVFTGYLSTGVGKKAEITGPFGY